MSAPAHRSRLLVALLAAATLVACSGDDDDDDAAGGGATAGTGTGTGTTVEADETSQATVGTGTAAPGIEPFCEAVIAADTAAAGDDETELRDALETLTAEAPSELEETVATIVAAAEAGEPLEEAYNELLEFMRANCGFNLLAFTVSDTSFSGVPTAAPAGPAIFTIENTTAIDQAVLIARINDDVSEPATELARLPTQEALERFAVRVSVAVGPGETTYATTELDSGRYLAAAVLPAGILPGGSTTTSTSTAGSAPASAAQSGQTLGIVKEFTVS